MKDKKEPIGNVEKYISASEKCIYMMISFLLSVYFGTSSKEVKMLP